VGDKRSSAWAWGGVVKMGGRPRDWEVSAEMGG